ncbi:MAG: RNA-binding cell elongation regulator Jag/EloR [Armatimonadota bacterium]|nr:RNA-binding cell elongation regulator Jag/EloR [Armatimonadota bacterium]MDR7421008.1 RNA-binding cell elongation regulator Jag/EloR [Armatimonadota bacterium]MDR7453295.1 RNA-binding cell elongation regulator Jag/EloR [Armatimonadota bacterium]MDR7497427.1 RNA-binding cell elongation regulator Jag/EloR [Armatimonadota bacterium]MDR7510986.1 RNA-binding cell elongation regulator Jag/EloR [Armatimonadota bacterium]
MNGVEASGRSVEEAVQRALAEMGAARDDVDVEVLQDPRPALLGFGGREARVRVTRRPSPADVAAAFVAQVFELMGHRVEVEVAERDEGLSLTLAGAPVRALVGRGGEMLDAIEVLTALHLQRRLGRRVQVAVDAAGYRAQQEKTLVDAAREAADRAVREGTAVALDPMDPKQRRVVHLALRDDPRVTTASEGEDEHRHVVIIPREDAPART